MTESQPAITFLPIDYDKRLMLFSGRATGDLAARIAAKLGVELGPTTLKTFSNGEVYCRFGESIRGADVFIVQSTCGNAQTGLSANDALMELLLMIDATLFDRVSVVHSHVAGCELRAGCSVGPFAYLRPGTLLREGAKAGTFVEVKNSDIGAGAKVPHLSYVGDADVGENTNLGAGSITANYDGTHKHRTKIGARVHGGVDTSFVAPVTVGDDAWTAAGSVVTSDVPPGALAVARARQRNVERYGERRGK